MPATSQLLTIDPGGVAVLVNIKDVYGVSQTTYTASGGGTAHTFPLSISTPTAFHLTAGGVYTVSATRGGVEMAGTTVECREGVPVTFKVSYPVSSFPAAGTVGAVSLGSPALGGVADVLAAVTDTGEVQVITSDITNPDVPRNVTATTDGTAADIKAVQVIVTGTNIFDVAITETLPVFTVNTKTTVVGSKAFKTVTSVTLPVHDGTGATTSVGLGAKLGMPVLAARNNVFRAFLANVTEGTAPTVAVSASAIESNTVTLNSALDGTAVVVSVLP